MSPEYTLKIDSRSHQVKIERLDEGGVLIVNVGDQSFTLKASQNPDGSWTVNSTDTDYSVRVNSRKGKRYIIEINEEPLEVEWERIRTSDTTTHTGPTQAASGKRVKGGVYPPMPGKITEVKVNVGDSVSAGDTVCILEAMKMFNELKAPNDGVVKEINIEVGSSVTPNDLLVLIE